MATATETNPVNKLLDLKVKEYDNLPGMILGLDGWILRTLPKDTREQFLQMYERALRVAFHPDRCFEEDKKRSREAYLQSVSEAVRYMLSDDFAYEMISDTVPARKNPMVTLRQSIQVRDNIISRLDDTLKDASNNSQALDREISELRMKLVRQQEASKRLAASDSRLRMAARVVMRKFPVPCDIIKTEVVASFLQPIEERVILDSIASYSSKNEIGASSEWLTDAKWINEAQQQGWLSPSNTFIFRSGRTRSGLSLSIVGSMTIVHLCECIRKINGFPTVPSSKKTMDALNYIMSSITHETHDDYGLKVKPFLLSNFVSDMLLLVDERDEATNHRRHRLMVVHEVTSEHNLNKDEISGWKDRVRELSRKNYKLTVELNAKKEKIEKPLRDRISKISAQLQRSKKRIKQLLEFNSRLHELNDNLTKNAKISMLRQQSDHEKTQNQNGLNSTSDASTDGVKNHGVATALVVRVRRHRDGLRQGTKGEHDPGRKKSQLKNV